MGHKIYTGLDNEKRVAWLRMRAQAKYRNEQFNLTWDDFKTIWISGESIISRSNFKSLDNLASILIATTAISSINYVNDIITSTSASWKEYTSIDHAIEEQQYQHPK